VKSLPSARAKALSRRPVRGVARASGGFQGGVANWLPRRLGAADAPRERTVIQDRAEDLASSDPHAAGLVNSIAVNTVGIGLRPQSRLDFRRLGISEEAAGELQDQIEYVFAEWAPTADASERMSFGDMQYLNFLTTLIKGEFFNLCVDRSDDPERSVGFARGGPQNSDRRVRWSREKRRDHVQL